MTRFTIVLVALLSLCAFGLDSTDVVIDRNVNLQKSVKDLQSTNDQLVTFNTDLADTQARLPEARHTTLIQRGDALKTSWKNLTGPYEAEVKRHDAACPDSTTDAAVQANCEKWAENLDKVRASLAPGIKAWKVKKDSLYADMKDWDADNARVAHDQFGIQALEASKARILQYLNQLNTEVLSCREAIKGATLERMHEVCGEMWDGNVDKPGFVNQGTGTKSFGTGGNPTNEQEPHN